MFVVHTSNCHGQNCTRRAIFRLGIDTLIANILVIIIIIIILLLLFTRRCFWFRRVFLVGAVVGLKRWRRKLTTAWHDDALSFGSCA